MAERTRAVEEKLSDALHERLTQRFVDRRTSVLMRDLGGKGKAEFPCWSTSRARSRSAPIPIGRMDGFHSKWTRRPATPTARCFSPPPNGGLAANMRSARPLSSPIRTIISASAPSPTSRWRSSGVGHEVARLGPGKNLLSPRVHLDRRIERVSDRGREAVIERLKNWVRGQVERSLGSLRSAGAAAQDPSAGRCVRSVLAMLVDDGGIIARAEVA
jgi:ATP-dependent RNA helicase SUPV3L1/SUV3